MKLDSSRMIAQVNVVGIALAVLDLVTRSSKARGKAISQQGRQGPAG